MAADASTASAVISPLPAVERLEFAGHDIDGAEQQSRRVRIVGDGVEGAEVDRLVEQRPQMVEREIGGRVVVRADCRARPGSWPADWTQSIQVLSSCSGSDDAELFAQNCGSNLPRPGRLVADQRGPGDQRADRAAGGAAEPDDPVPGQHVFGEEPAENACGEGGMAAAALAGDGHPRPSDRADRLIRLRWSSRLRRAAPDQVSRSLGPSVGSRHQEEYGLRPAGCRSIRRPHRWPTVMQPAAATHSAGTTRKATCTPSSVGQRAEHERPEAGGEPDADAHHRDGPVGLPAGQRHHHGRAQRVLAGDPEPDDQQTRRRPPPARWTARPAPSRRRSPRRRPGTGRAGIGCGPARR